jgi:hypothetical protein
VIYGVGDLDLKGKSYIILIMSITGIINEERRTISCFANYQVSNIGRLIRVEAERIMKPNIRKDGYYRICLYTGKSTTYLYIHRLVAQEFIEHPDNKNCVDHVNHDVPNNTIHNLRWLSKSGNGMNMLRRQNAFSKYKGVSFSSAGQ